MVLVFCVYAAFLSNQEAGFGISVCLIPWDMVGYTRPGLEKNHEVPWRSNFPQPAGLGHSCPQLPQSSRCPELVDSGNQVWKFKNKGMRLKPSVSL